MTARRWKRYQEEGNEEKGKWSSSEKIFLDLSVTVGLLVLATAISVLFRGLGFRNDNLILVYVTGALLEALLVRIRWSSVFYGAGSVILFNCFFIEPTWTLKVTDKGYIVTFLVMFATSQVISSLMRQVKRAQMQASVKAYRTAVLLENSQRLQQAKTPEEIGRCAAQQLEKLMNVPVYCFLGEPKITVPVTGYIKSDEKNPDLSANEIAVAKWAFRNNRHAGATTDILPGSGGLYLAVRSQEQVFAVVGIRAVEKVPTNFEKDLMLAMLNEAALAFEKEQMQKKNQETALKLQQEQLRGNLLRMISHDLRTPLTSISGNADMLLENEHRLDNETRHQIFLDIYEDSVWLIDLVENLLSVTRIENGTMELHMQSEMVEDVIQESVKRAKRCMNSHTLIVEQEDDLLMARMDAKLIVQVLNNLLNNAVKYSPSGTEIRLCVYEKDHHVFFEVADQGKGIAEEEKDKIFSLFYAGNHPNIDGRRSMGLGLALCKSIVEAHQGRIWVKDHVPRGSIFGFELMAEEVKMI